MSNRKQSFPTNWLYTLAAIRGAIITCIVSIVSPYLVFLCLISIGGHAHATDFSRSRALDSIYEHAGVHAHLSRVYSTVVDETQQAWQRCDSNQSHSRTVSMLKEHLSIDVLRQGFLNQLDQRISDEHLVQIISWIQSDTGKNIHRAELNSRDIDESSFDSLLHNYKQSEVHGDERNVRLNRMLADTGAVYFLSALNTELSALVSIAGVCSNNVEALAMAQNQINEDRSSEALYRSFMRNQLLIPSAVVYRHISNADLDALSVFAKSDAGNAYYKSLIQGTRSVLAQEVDRLSRYAETIRIINVD